MIFLPWPFVIPKGWRSTKYHWFRVTYPPLTLTVRTWKWMVGKLVSFWGPAYLQGQTVSFRECNHPFKKDHEPKVTDNKPTNTNTMGCPVGYFRCSFSALWLEPSPAKRELKMKVSSSFPCFYLWCFIQGRDHLIAKLMEKWTFWINFKSI